ncbi:MAG TPA: O-antigen ligase family protein [Caldilineaceae bacterium]|nr:O-antigen ligase family protein [Caldilineaceae bacterium]
MTSLRDSHTPGARADRWSTGLRRGIALLLLLLPLWFNPWVALPFEPAKVALLRYTVLLLFLTAALAMGISAHFRRSGWERLRRSWLPVVAGLGYGAVFTVAGVVSVAPEQSFWGLSDGHGVVTLWAQIGLFLLIVVLVDGNNDRAEIVRWLLLGSVSVILYGLVQAVGLDPLRWQSDSVSPVLSTLGRSNFLGAYLAILLPFGLTHAMALWSDASLLPRRRGAGLLLLGLHALCLLLTLARSAWVAGVIGALLFMWWMPSPQTVSRLLYRGLLLVGAGLLLVTFFLLGEHTGRVQFAKQTESSAVSQQMPGVESAYQELREVSPARRWIIWQAAWSLIGERPLLGYGPEMFVTVFNQRYPPGSLYAGRDTLVDDPHNVLLEHLLATGFLGLAVWLAFLGIIAWKGLHSLTNAHRPDRLINAACLASLVAWWIQAQLNPDVVAVSTLSWAIAGLIVATPTTEHSQLA